MPERFGRNGFTATSFRLAFNRTQTCTSTCAVKGPHSAPLAAKGFFGKCQNRAARIGSTARLSGSLVITSISVPNPESVAVRLTII